jgi:HEAT repeat protein/3',5'-cyclic AMP phosphodiesterase CpdA
MLQQMGDRLQKFAETPLLLVMLCDVFEKHLRIPANLGEAFREFAQIYDSKLKESNVPTRENSQTVWPELLQHLAFVMMQGSSPTELNLTISKQKAIKLIYKKFKISHEKASLWLEDLLKYHLIQINNGNKIEFRHQLIQEYYSAEYLLRYLDKIDQEKLVHEYLNYLNYLKWTEPLTLMVELSEKAEQVLQVVSLALEIDLELAARLAGSVNAKFADKAIELIIQRKINQILKIKILGKTKSINALPYLLNALKDHKAMTRMYAASTLGHIEFFEAVPDLLNALNDDDPNVRSKVAISLGEIGCFDVVEMLLARLINNSEVSSVRFSIAFALGKIGNSKINPVLIEEFFNANEDEDWLIITVALEKLANEDTVLALIEKTRNGSIGDRGRGIYILEKICSKIAIPVLKEILENTNEWCLNRAAAAEALGIIGDNSILPILLHFLYDEDAFVRSGCAKALGNFGGDYVIDILLQILDHDDYRVHQPAIYALGSIGSEKAVPKLCSILEENINLEDSINTDKGEGENDIKSAQLAIKNRLININKKSLRIPAIRALGEIGSEKAIPTLVLLLDRHESVNFVIHSLGGIQSKSVAPILVDFLSNHQDSGIRSGAAISIARIADESTAPMLISASNDIDCNVASSSIYALGKVGKIENLSFLSNFLLDSIDEKLIDASLTAISEIQNRCKFYDFSLTLPNSVLEKANMNQKSISRIIVASPGDVQAERDLLPRVIDELNRGIAADRNLRLELVRWETDSFPGFHPEGPQGPIDSVLKIEDCDILIGIFWKRFGTPVMNANSGTEHEFLTAYEARKQKGSPQIMVYFNQKPYNPSSSKESEQWTQVLRFKENFPEEGLWWKYEGEADFERKVRNHLTHFIRNRYSNNESKHYLSKTVASESRLQQLGTRNIQILHLSDLHFGTPQQAKLWASQLTEDLHRELNTQKLQALIISGDIANFASPSEYDAAQQFLQTICKNFQLQPDQITVVPGNHDISWTTTDWEQADDVAYRNKLRRQCSPNELKPEMFIEEGTSTVWVRDPDKYQHRFANFSNFYQTIKNQPYPLTYDQQYTFTAFPNHNLLILGLNSAWELDHYFKDRASIHPEALSNALDELRQSDYEHYLKVAVWHHPLNSPWNDRIKDEDFMERLAIAGFKIFLHGHIHKNKKSFYEYDAERGLYGICAGTFGAPTKELDAGVPWQYHLLSLDQKQITIRSRKRTSETGVWESDACWKQGRGKTSLDYWQIQISQ